MSAHTLTKEQRYENINKTIAMMKESFQQARQIGNEELMQNSSARISKLESEKWKLLDSGLI